MKMNGVFLSFFCEQTDGLLYKLNTVIYGDREVAWDCHNSSLA